MIAALRGALAALAATFLVVADAGPSAASERILDFASRIQVHADGALTVTETIKVVAAGEQIKRGIYRDFPTTYRDRYGNAVRVGFDVVAVQRDGRPEPYHTKAVSNGTRVYIGEEGVFLQPGTYTYAITYETTGQLGFFDDFDELYWNVTGNDWAFTIENARATVELPRGAPVLSVIGYTGAQGAKGTDYGSSTSSVGRLTFATTRALDPGEGLTIVVSWPKGFVTEPTAADRLGFFLADNAATAAGLIGLAVIIVYYLFAWVRVGRDPESGTIVPLFDPPKGFSPAAVRFVMRMGFDHKAFAASIVSMAVKGYLTIREGVGGDYSIEKTGADRSLLSRGEREVAAFLLGGAKSIELKNTNHKKLGKAIDGLKKSLAGEFEKIHFLRNRTHLVPGVVLSLLTLVALAAGARQPEAAAFMIVWLSVWSGACWFLARTVVVAWRSGKRGVIVFTTLFAAPFFIGEFFGIGLMSANAGAAAVALLLVVVAVNVLFYELMKAPTLKGRKIMDQIEGFKQFLSVAEKERLGVLNPPDTTPELFEKFLPFALALDVEHEWSERFAGVLAAAGQDRDYHPRWYSGHMWHDHGATGLADGLGGAFTGAISSSSAAPGSSSGGGGGSSGGGGGGGGGGGW